MINFNTFINCNIQEYARYVLTVNNFISYKFITYIDEQTLCDQIILGFNL